ncbi:MAG: gliding motility-associated C-terminal domain-containing protein [Bacteroidales bacterium]|nr:gliding motility-associated C-terminal domain-containing protein [Bacteroidales bacterium]
MKQVIAIIFFMFSGYIKIFAQLETSVWYFGDNAGLDFKTKIPKALTDGALKNYEGVASFSDKFGNLLLYTDGRTVWNKNHEIMENGENLLGHESSTESAIIVPWPENENLYYIFVVDEQGGVNGLSYSIVDMSLNDGLGAITDHKNIIIETPVCEKVTAIRHQNNKDIWLLTKSAKSNDLIEWLIDENGINLDSKQNFPISMIDHGLIPEKYINNYVEIVDNYEKKLATGGYMRVSPNGKKIACANIGYFSLQEDPDRKFSLLEIFNFNPTTGEITQDMVFYDYFLNLYGVEFSNDASKLYYTTQQVVKNAEGSKITFNHIFQIDLSLPTKTAIEESTTIIGEYKTPKIDLLPGALQLATNGKIYVAQDGSDYLGVINFPRNKGTDCQFESLGQYLEGKKSRSGLPNFIPSYFLPPKFEISNNCTLDKTFFKCLDERNITNYEWILSNINDEKIAESNEKDFEYEITEKGKYKITLTITLESNEEVSEYRYFYVYENPEFTFGPDINICEGENAEIKAAELSDCEFHWLDDIEDKTITVTENKTISGTLKNIYTLCEFSDEISVKVNSPEEFSLGNDMEFCKNETLKSDFKIENPERFSSFEWLDNKSSEVNRTFSKQGNYTLESTDLNGCKFQDEIFIKENPLPEIDFSTDSIFCNNKDNFLDCKVENAKYLWSTGEETQVIKVKDFGNYSVTVTDENGCFSTSSVNLKLKTLPEINLNADTSYCEGESLVLDVFWKDATDYIWQDFSNTENYEVTTPGIYTVKTYNVCGFSSNTVNVYERYCGEILIPNIITPNNDGINDYFKIKGLGSGWQLEIFTREGVRVFKTDNYKNDWSAENISDGVYFYVLKKNGEHYKGNISVFHKKL